MAASSSRTSMTPPPPGLAREFFASFSLPTRPSKTKIRRDGHCSGPCSPHSSPLPRTRAPASLRDYELHLRPGLEPTTKTSPTRTLHGLLSVRLRHGTGHRTQAPPRRTRAGTAMPCAPTRSSGSFFTDLVV